MSRPRNENLKRLRIGPLPILVAMAKRLGIAQVFERYFPSDPRESIPCHFTLLMMIYNLACARNPLYELDSWVSGFDPRILGMPDHEACAWNDDRFGRALDRLHDADRASLQTAIVMSVAKAIDLNFDQIHNDSTTVSAYGYIPGTTRSNFRLARGHSKDHRPDLKQLVYSLSISRDGGIPIHFKNYPGNTTDDTTHIETWDALRSLVGRNDFLYVADSKLCTAKQLEHIVTNGGRALSVVPNTWKETKDFKERLRKGAIPKNKIKKKALRRQGEFDIYSQYSGDFVSTKLGFTIHWIHSTAKQQRDRESRAGRLAKAEAELNDLSAKLNNRSSTHSQKIQDRLDKILKKYRVERFIAVQLSAIEHKHKVQAGRGRPGPSTKYRTLTKRQLVLEFQRIKVELKREERVDGIFPILCTDPALTTRQALDAYKYQPNLEKRFSQFKSVHKAAPLLFKRIDRVESTMFLFFVALILQAHIERQLRMGLTEQAIEAIPLYPENRLSYQPTTARLFDRFDDICVYQLTFQKYCQEFRDGLSKLHRQLLELLKIDEHRYWLQAA